MAIKTFTTGEVLTAADTNTFLANSGLVYVSSGSFTNAASFDATGFTSTYAMFRLVLVVGRHTGSGASDITATVRDATSPYATGYFGASFEASYLATSAVVGARNNGVNFLCGAVNTAGGPNRVFLDVGGMNTTSSKFSISGTFYNFSPAAVTMIGYENTGLSLNLDRIRFACGVNMTGSWRLYGYREA